MTSRGYTTKPCPGCRKEITHPINGICQTCEEKIKEAEAQRRVNGERQGMRAYLIPTYHVPGYPTDYKGNKKHRDFIGVAEDKFLHLIKSVSEPATHEWFVANGGYPSNYYEIRLFKPPRDVRIESTHKALLRPDVAQAILDLDDALADAIKQTYQDGLSDGGNLLRSLASGSISVQELNERTAQNNTVDGGVK